jgi:hypothetical protein
MAPYNPKQYMKSFGLGKKKQKSKNNQEPTEESSAYGHGDEGTNANPMHSSRFDANLDLGGHVPSDDDEYEA